jgi:hypothetical protein
VLELSGGVLELSGGFGSIEPARSLRRVRQGSHRRMTEFEREQEDLAAAEAGSIGGSTSSETSGAEAEDPAQQPLIEAGEGEAEGFEQAERELVEHASHGDQHAARQAIEDVSGSPEDPRATPAGEADEELSTEADSNRT